MENPRVEATEHPLEVVSTKLPNTFGFETKVPPILEVERMLAV